MAYAWSPIRYGGKGDPETGAISDVQVVEAGDEVDAGKLGISDEEFEALVESGAVREEKYPENIPAGMSAMQFIRQQAMDAGHAAETTGGTWMLNETQQMEVARAAQMDVEERGEGEDEEVTPEDARQALTPITEGKDLSLPSGEAEKPQAEAPKEAPKEAAAAK